jgi:hypothetical protein
MTQLFGIHIQNFPFANFYQGNIYTDSFGTVCIYAMIMAIFCFAIIIV